MTIETRADEPLDCNVRIFFFPRWRCTIDGVETAIRMQTDGSILFSVPAGTHTVELAYADSAISLFAKALSAAGLAGAAAARLILQEESRVLLPPTRPVSPDHIYRPPQMGQI